MPRICFKKIVPYVPTQDREPNNVHGNCKMHSKSAVIFPIELQSPLNHVFTVTINVQEECNGIIKVVQIEYA